MGRLYLGKFCLTLAFSVSLVVAALGLGSQASASPLWCEEDPTFVVNGTLLDVTTTFLSYYAGSVRGAVAFELLVPSNVTAAVVSLPGAVPVTGKITPSLPPTQGLWGVPVVVKVTVSAYADFATSTRVTGTFSGLATTVQGRSNTTTYVSYTLVGANVPTFQLTQNVLPQTIEVPLGIGL
jgi:hypothetical protein